MCGIAGVRRFDGAPVEAELLRTMAAQLEHRGPDAQGVWTSGSEASDASDCSVGFANRRLAIIDVGGSPQPMTSHDGRLTVTFNGEIFNYESLRKRYEYPWHTHGDTEVLLAAFESDGARSVQAMRGQFAYAVHDTTDDTVWLFRDRMGIVPLYYYADSAMFAFASEIKALLPALPKQLEVDEASLSDYLAHRSVPAPHTLFKGIRKVPAGNRLRVGRDGDVRIEPYWQIPAEPAYLEIGDREAIGAVSDALNDAVDSALVADVPVGTYLSGGIDSSLITALVARRKPPGALKTFSAVFGDPRYDEGPDAAELAAQLGTEHHSVSVTPDDFERLWHRMTWHRDAPLAQPSEIALFRLAETAREHVKVVLSGEGSDELFAGYPKYRYARLTTTSLPPTWVRDVFATSLDQRLPASAARLRIALRALSARTDADRVRAWFEPFSDRERVSLVDNRGRRGHVGVYGRAQGDPLQRMLYTDCHTWLSDNLLDGADRMSMAASIELRPPFLDHRLVELAFALPNRFKVRRGTSKWVVKEVARAYLPEAIVQRRKIGFRVPLDIWFRDRLHDMARDLLLGPSSFVGQVMDPTMVRQLLDRHASGRANEDIRIWTLLGLEVWHQEFFRSAGHTTPPAPRAG